MAIKPKRQYMVIKRRERPDLDNLYGHKFGRKSKSFVTDDPGLAKEIDQRFGVKGRDQDAHSVIVADIPDRREQRTGYRVYFQVPEMPWKKVQSASKKSKARSSGGG